MPYQKEAREILSIFLDRLLLREKKEFVLLANKWGVVETELNVMIQKLAEKEVKSENQLYNLALYKEFLSTSKTQIKNYSNIASKIISYEQKNFGKAGLEVTQSMIELETRFFQRLPVDVINNFIGKSFYDGAKLDDTLFLRSYSAYAEKTKDLLLQGVALGRNPRETARLIRKESNAPLWQSLRLARTEQLNIFRETSLLQMKESGVCKGWERIEEDDACDECKEANGKIFSLDEPFDTHPNCRGAMLPVAE